MRKWPYHPDDYDDVDPDAKVRRRYEYALAGLLLVLLVFGCARW